MSGIDQVYIMFWARRCRYVALRSVLGVLVLLPLLSLLVIRLYITSAVSHLATLVNSDFPPPRHCNAPERRPPVGVDSGAMLQRLISKMEPIRFTESESVR